MSTLINPLYVPLLKPNDIFYYFNEQPNQFRDVVLDNFKDIDQFEVTSMNKFVFSDGNKFRNKLLNDKNSVKIIKPDIILDKEISEKAINLMESILIVCIKTKNFIPMIDILSKILIDAKIPSDPTFNEDIELSQNDISMIKQKFQRKILAKYIIDYLTKSKSASVRLGVDKFKLESYARSKVKKQKLEQAIMKGTAWEIIKKFVNPKKVDSLDKVINIMANSPMEKTMNIPMNIKAEMRKMNRDTYGTYIEAMLKKDHNTKNAFEIAKKIQLYNKKQSTIYNNVEKMFNIVHSFVNIAFEAWYINQNIAGILKYYSVISNIKPEIINSYVEKQDQARTSIGTYKRMVMTHLNNLYDSGGNLMNLEMNFYRIFCEIKNTTFSTRLFQNDVQEKNNELIVRDIINPYIEGNEPRIEDFKMFYVLSNNNTQLKCLNQAELFLNTRAFIDNIGRK